MYLKERNCLRDKYSRFSRIFAKIPKLNPREKSTDSQFAKLNPREKKGFFRFSELVKLTFLHYVLYQLTMVMSKIFHRIPNNIIRDNIERKM